MRRGEGVGWGAGASRVGSGWVDGGVGVGWGGGRYF